MTETYRYDAFISYRHVEPDREWAKWLRRALETYRTPRALVNSGVPKRLTRVCRDEEELSADADLSDSIRIALEQSRFLIVVCSPRAPQSRWVNAEVEQFRAMGRHDRILAMLIEGEPSESFPPGLTEIRRTVVDAEGQSREEIEEVEPLAADVRPREGEKGHALRGHARLRLLASILGCQFDDLRRREQERRSQRARRVGVALLAVFIVMTGLTFFAMAQRSEAKRQAINAGQNESAANASAKEARRQATIADENARVAAENEAEAKRQEGLAKANEVLARANAAEAKRQSAIAMANEALAKANEEEAQRSSYVSGVIGAAAKVRIGEFKSAYGLLQTCPENRREWEWRFLLNFADGSDLALLSEAELSRIQYNPNVENLLAVSGDGAYFARASPYTNIISVISTTTCRIIASIKVWDRPRSIEFSKDAGSILVAAGNSAAIIDVHSKTVTTRFVGHDDSVVISRFCNLFESVATSAMDNSARLWDAATGEQTGEIEIFHNGSGLVIAPCGRLILTQERRTRRLWSLGDLSARVLTSELRNLDGEGVFNHSGRLLALAEPLLGGFVLLELPDGREVRHSGGLFSAILSRDAAMRSSGNTNSLSFSGDDAWIAIAESDGKVALHSLKTSEVRLLSKPSPVVPACVAFSHDSSMVAATYKDGSVRIWQCPSMSLMRTWWGGEYAIESAVWSRDDRCLFTISSDSSVRMWSADTVQDQSTTFDGEAIAETPQVKGWLNAASVESATRGATTVIRSSVPQHHEGVFVTGAYIGSNRNEANRLRGHAGSVNSVALNASGTRAVTAGEDGTVRVWDVWTRRELITLTGHHGGVEAAAFSPDDAVIVSKDESGSVRMFDARRRYEQKRETMHP